MDKRWDECTPAEVEGIARQRDALLGLLVEYSEARRGWFARLRGQPESSHPHFSFHETREQAEAAVFRAAGIESEVTLGH